MQVEDFIIIGAGPAGLAAAIQLRRYGFYPCIFECHEVGGLLRNANLVENYPGFPGGITGPRLVKLFVRQAQQAGVEVIHEEVTQVDFAQGCFQVKTNRKNYRAQVVIVATGTKPLRMAELPVPQDLLDRVFYEVHELLQVEGKQVVLVGSGDAAFDYALNLSRLNRVILLNRGDVPKCLPLLWERARQVKSISYRNHTIVQKVTKVMPSGMLVDCQTNSGALQFHADYLLVAIGREANLDCLSVSLRQQQSMLEEQGILYFIGDVKNGIYRQTSIAVGEGVMAAMRAYPKVKEIP